MTQALVIGSGPSGLAVAHALLRRGLRVTMIDGGRSQGCHDPALKARLAASRPQDWTEEDRRAWQAPQFATPDGQVRRYGDDGAMQPAEELFDPAGDMPAVRGSLAAGGLSNLWGAAIAVHDAADMAGWPVDRAEMLPHYRALADVVPGVAAALDEGPPSGPPPGPQAAEVLARTRPWPAAGVTLGPAVTATAPGCSLCGMCLHGCPWDLIWKSTTALTALRRDAGFTYVAGPPVRALTQEGDAIVARLDDGTALSAPRVFLAAGVLNSAQILLASGLAAELTLADSQFAFLPLLHRWSTRPAPDQAPAATLPQLFAGIDCPAASPHAVHAQIYGWNEFYARDLIANYGRFLPGSAPLWRALARHMMVAQIFLHSDHGARLTLSPGAGGRLRAQIAPGDELLARMTAAQRALGRALRPMGLHALTPAARLSAPGASFHLGASLPMAADPGPGQTDVLGRLPGLERLHIVDASVLPAIPARTITLPVMANAHRIGAEAPADS